MENIGKQGSSLNDSVASSAMNMKPNEEHLKKYDEYPVSRNTIHYIFIVADVLLTAFTAYLFYSGHWIWGIVLLLVSLILLVFTYSICNSNMIKEIAYENGLLIPAIVVNTNPIELVVMADMSTLDGQDPIYGCLKIRANKLPNHKIEINEKVPCVSLFGNTNSKNYRFEFEPRPVCWGFDKKEYIDAAQNAIEESEWQLLSSIASANKDKLSNKTVSFFDKDGNPYKM